jgi:hypothetical protein
MPVAPAEPVVQKLDDAQKILVVGDFLAGGLGDGLTAAFETSPGVVVEARSNVSSGLVRDDYYNWAGELPKMIDELKPAMVVVMIGANDRQQMVTDAGKEKFRTDGWFTEYQRRVLAFGKEITSRKIPLLWVGLPAFESDSMTADAVQMNQLYRNQMESIGGEFVDIWDGFVDENGAFVMNGPDMNGQPVRLRSSDGQTLSTPGKRKVAFYVEKPLNKLLGGETAPAPGLPGIAGPTAPVNIYVDRTDPMAINDPELDGGQQLLGLKSTPKVETRTAGERLAVEGIAPASSPGRADDFGGRREPAALTAAPVADQPPVAAEGTDTTTAIRR